MVSERMKAEQPFGVVLIKEGNEAGQPATFHTTGTLATIVDFEQLDDGFLGLSCKGLQKFTVTDHRLQPDQLVIGDIERVVDPHEGPVNKDLKAAFQSVSDFLRAVLGSKELKADAGEIHGEWDELDWISYRAAELLPLGTCSRQRMLKMGTAERLAELSVVFSEFRHA